MTDTEETGGYLIFLVPAELWESVGSRGRHQKSGRQSFPQYAFCKMTGGKFPIECYKRHKREKTGARASKEGGKRLSYAFPD